MRLEAGDVEEVRVALMEAARLDPEADSAVEAAYVEAAVRFQETGEPQPFRFPDDYGAVTLFVAPDWYSMIGQKELALAALETLAPRGNLQAIAVYYVARGEAFFGDDARYRAILDRARITW